VHCRVGDHLTASSVLLLTKRPLLSDDRRRTLSGGLRCMSIWLVVSLAQTVDVTSLQPVCIKTTGVFSGLDRYGRSALSRYGLSFLLGTFCGRDFGHCQKLCEWPDLSTKMAYIWSEILTLDLRITMQEC
jgi:hypothetical protein